MKAKDLIPGRCYAGPAGQVRELLAVSVNQQRVRYRQISTSKREGGGQIEPGMVRWIDAASFLAWALCEVPA